MIFIQKRSVSKQEKDKDCHWVEAEVNLVFGHINVTLDSLQNAFGETMGGIVYFPSCIGDVCWTAAVLSALGNIWIFLRFLGCRQLCIASKLEYFCCCLVIVCSHSFQIQSWYESAITQLSGELSRVRHRVNVQVVKSLGRHFACLCREFDFYEVKKLLFFF